MEKTKGGSFPSPKKYGMKGVKVASRDAKRDRRAVAEWEERFPITGGCRPTHTPTTPHTTLDHAETSKGGKMVSCCRHRIIATETGGCVCMCVLRSCGKLRSEGGRKKRKDYRSVPVLRNRKGWGGGQKNKQQQQQQTKK